MTFRLFHAVPKTKKWNKSNAYVNVGDYKHLDPGIINFQGRASSFLSLRSAFPLKEEDVKAPLVTLETTTATAATAVAESKEAADPIPDVRYGASKSPCFIDRIDRTLKGL